jgi:EAL domain-containing protein (putative c-di-GMP-specific phosphodiesterase class I)
LAKSGLKGQNLKLELTEPTIMENSDIARNILLDLKTNGISLPVDDFGMGYSSLSYLSRIPATSIKTDRTIIQNIDKNYEGVNMVNTILNLAKSLGMTVIANGIETQQQAIKLKNLGCHYAQGFLFSRALVADQIPDIIKVGNTSLTIHIEVTVVSHDNEEETVVTEGDFIFVALDENNRPKKIER